MRVSARCSQSLGLSPDDVRVLGNECAKMFLEEGGKPGVSDEGRRMMLDGRELVAYTDYMSNGTIYVTVATAEEAAQWEESDFSHAVMLTP